MVGKVFPIVECSGIAKIVRQPELCGALNAVAIVKNRERRILLQGSTLFFRRRTVNVQSNTGMNFFDVPSRCLYLFCFHIERLLHFSETSALPTAVTRNVRGDFYFLPVSEGLNSGVETNRAAPD